MLEKAKDLELVVGEEHDPIYERKFKLFEMLGKNTFEKDILFFE